MGVWRRYRRVGIGLAAVLCVVTLVLVLWPGDDPQPPATVPAPTDEAQPSATTPLLNNKPQPSATVLPESEERLEERMSMVDRQIRRRGVSDQDVLDAMERVPRHEFVPDELKGQAYADRPLPIGYGQTISQPYICLLYTSDAADEVSPV
mgnify:FL=1